MARPASEATEAWPVTSSVPATAWTAPCTAAAATRTRWRGSRSAQTPAASVIAAAAPWRQASTTPIDAGEFEMSRTAKTIAIAAERRDGLTGEEETVVALGERSKPDGQL